MLNAGMYPADIARLEHHQIKPGRIIRKRSKTEGWSNVPIVSYKLWADTATLLEQERSSDKRYALTNENGGQLRRILIGDDGKMTKICNITSAFKRASKRLGLTFAMSHLRKTSANLLFNNPEFRHLHQLFLGHS
jgi:hypothetical protein